MTRTVTGVPDLDDRLARGETLLLDGGMGTEMEARHVPMSSDAWGAVANLEHPGIVEAAHADFLDAGADLIIANTFASTLFSLEAAGLGDRFEEANRRAVEAARRARDRMAPDRPVAVAGSMSPMTAGAVVGLDERPTDELLEGSRRQAAALAEAGADLLIAEMIQSAHWHGPIVRAAVDTGLPTWLGVSAGSRSADGRLAAQDFPELDFEEAVSELADLPVTAVAVMHTDVEEIDAALDVVGRHWDGVVAVYPHRGTYDPPSWTFVDIAPEELADRARSWVQRGARIIGGCCGIRPHHIRLLRGQLGA